MKRRHTKRRKIQRRDTRGWDWVSVALVAIVIVIALTVKRWL